MDGNTCPWKKVGLGGGARAMAFTVGPEKSFLSSPTSGGCSKTLVIARRTMCSMVFPYREGRELAGTPPRKRKLAGKGGSNQHLSRSSSQHFLKSLKRPRRLS